MSDIKTAAARFVMDSGISGGGTQDLTIAGLGWTPKAVIFITSPANTSTNPIGDLSYSVGAATGVDNEWACWGLCDTGRANQAVARRLFASRCMYVSRATSGGSAYVNSSFNSFISNGVRVTHESSPFANVQVLAVFFGGADLQAHADLVPLGTGTAAIDVTAPGFEPTAVFFSGTGDDAAGGVTNFFLPSFAFAQNQATVREKMLAEEAPSGSADGDPIAVLEDGRVGQQGVDGVTWFATISDYDASGFSITPSSSAGDDDLPYLALDTGDSAVYTDIVDGPTSTGSDWSVNTGFEPQVAMLITTMLQSVGTSANDSDAGAFGFSAFDGARENSIRFSNEDASATTDTESGFQANKGLYLVNDAQDTVVFDANSPSFNSTGFTFSAANIDTAQPTARKFLVFAVEVESVGADFTLTADQGSFTLSGQAADLTASRLLTANQGSFSLTGQDATLAFTKVLEAAQGSYSLSGQPAGLLASRTLTADQGSYTLSGQDATLTVTVTLDAEQGSYTFTGQDAGLITSRLLEANQGSYSLTGQAATLTFQAAEISPLIAEQGSYSLTGQTADLVVSFKLNAVQGTYTLTGQDVDLIAQLVGDATGAVTRKVFPERFTAKANDTTTAKVH